MYFSRPIRFPRTLVCGLFKKLKFSGRRYFRVPLPILLAASPLASRLRRQNFISRALTIPPATQARGGRAVFLLFIISYCMLSLHIITFPQGYAGALRSNINKTKHQILIKHKFYFTLFWCVHGSNGLYTYLMLQEHLLNVKKRCS